MKYYLLNNQTLHECETPKERIELTKKLLGDPSEHVSDTPKMLKKLSTIGRVGHDAENYWWFNATLCPSRIMAMLHGIDAKIDRLRGERTTTGIVAQAPGLKPDTTKLVSTNSAPAPAIAEAVQLGGGMSLEPEKTDAGTVWRVTSGGTVLASTKPGGRFLIISDTAVDGAWFQAASHILDTLVN
jgi:hypothetical protein